MNNENWHNAARKLGGEQLIPVIEKIQEDHNELSKKFSKSFPAGDHEGHCRYHDAIIERTAEIKKLRMAIQEKTISALVWSAILGIGLAVWHELQRAFIK